jgi:hypothetical protein
MTHLTTNVARLSIAAIAGFVALFWSGQLPVSHRSPLVAAAEARVGRPATPMSYAGVARRTTGRAVAVGAATTTCVQVVNSYGQITRVCK